MMPEDILIDPIDQRKRKLWLYVTMAHLFLVNWVIIPLVWCFVGFNYLPDESKEAFQSTLIPLILVCLMSISLLYFYALYRCAYRKHGNKWLITCLIFSILPRITSSAWVHPLDILSNGICVWWVILSIQLIGLNKKIQLRKNYTASEMQPSENITPNEPTVQSENEVGSPGFREKFNYKEEIGTVCIKNQDVSTTWGIVHYSSQGAHIVPAVPDGIPVGEDINETILLMLCRYLREEIPPSLRAVAFCFKNKLLTIYYIYRGAYPSEQEQEDLDCVTSWVLAFIPDACCRSLFLQSDFWPLPRNGENDEGKFTFTYAFSKDFPLPLQFDPSKITSWPIEMQASLYLCQALLAKISPKLLIAGIGETTPSKIKAYFVLDENPSEQDMALTLSAAEELSREFPIVESVIEVTPKVTAEFYDVVFLKKPLKEQDLPSLQQT